VRVLTGIERAAGLRTYGSLEVAVCEFCRLGCEGVDVGCADEFVAEASNGIVAKLIGHKYQEVGSCIREA
jgi:hypothetical protein